MTQPAKLTDFGLPVQVAGCILLNEAGEWLLLHRNTDKFVHWELPGGKVEPDEVAADAAMREFLEETGLSVRIVRELGVGTFSQQEDAKSYKYHWYLAETDDTHEPLAKEARLHDDIGWFSQEAIMELETISKNLQVLLGAMNRGEVQL